MESQSLSQVVVRLTASTEAFAASLERARKAFESIDWSEFADEHDETWGAFRVDGWLGDPDAWKGAP
jgi:hypothetical protein